MLNKDYIVQIKIKNGPLLRAMRRRGIYTAAELGRQTGCSNTAVGGYLNLKVSPLNREGLWKGDIERISEVLRTMPSDLFPAQHIKSVLKKNIAEISINAEQLVGIASSDQNLEQLVLSQEKHTDLFTRLSCLDPRSRRIIEMRFGFTGLEKTYADIAALLGLSGERVRQIEQKALRKLRYRINKEDKDFEDVEPLNVRTL